MSEVLAQLEKKGGGGDYADSYMISSYAMANANHSATCHIPSRYVVGKYTQAKYTLVTGSNLVNARIGAYDSSLTSLSLMTLSTSWQDIPSRFYQSDVELIGLINNANAYDSVRIRIEFR